MFTALCLIFSHSHSIVERAEKIARLTERQRKTGDLLTSPPPPRVLRARLAGFFFLFFFSRALKSREAVDSVKDCAYDGSVDSKPVHTPILPGNARAFDSLSVPFIGHLLAKGCPEVGHLTI